MDFRCVLRSTSICGKMRDPGNKVDFIACTMGCTLRSIQHGRQVTRKDFLVSYIIGVLIKELTLLLEN